jgi:hypothetical protein
VRLTEDLIDQRDAVAARADGLLAGHETGKIEQLAGAFVRRVRALYVAKLTLPALVDDHLEVAVVEQLGALRAARNRCPDRRA